MKKLTVALVLVALLTLPMVGLAGPPVNNGLCEAEAQTSGAAFANSGRGWIAYWLIYMFVLGAGAPPPIGEYFDEWL